MESMAGSIPALVVMLWMGAGRLRDTWFGEALALAGLVCLTFGSAALSIDWPPDTPTDNFIVGVAFIMTAIGFVAIDQTLSAWRKRPLPHFEARVLSATVLRHLSDSLHFTARVKLEIVNRGAPGSPRLWQATVKHLGRAEFMSTGTFDKGSAPNGEVNLVTDDVPIPQGARRTGWVTFRLLSRSSPVLVQQVILRFCDQGDREFSIAFPPDEWLAAGATFFNAANL